MVYKTSEFHNWPNKLFLAGILVVSNISISFADEIADAISEAQKSYQSGDLVATKQALDTASQLISQRNAEGLAKALPKALQGWTADDADSRAIGLMALGGSMASRQYRKGETNDVIVSITADNAMLTQQLAVFANSQMAGLMGKLIKINSEKAIQTKEGDITMVIANRFVITVNGNASADDKIAYAKAIDINTLIKMN